MIAIQDAVIDFELIQGDDESLTVTFKDEDGAVIDITGYTVFFTMKKRPDDDSDDSDAPIKKTVTSHSDPTNGETIIYLTSAETAVLEARRYVYDLQLKDLSDKINSTKYGVLEVIKDVTNRTS